MRIAAFILSDVRSGSTLLDQCLGAHEQIASLGEVHWLAAYATRDRSLYNPVHELVCACGDAIEQCEFWSEVRARLGKPFESLTLHSGFSQMARSGSIWRRFKWLPRRLVRSKPILYRSRLLQEMLGGRQLAGDIGAVLDAACSAAERPLCVDSSKSPYRFRAVWERDPARNLGVVLVRDYRAVVHSKMKRGQSLEEAARGWRTAMEQIEALTADLPKDYIHHLTYESLCTEPQEALGRLCRFLGVEFSDAMLQRPVGKVHHIGGSPSKFDSARSAISLDRSHESAFSARELDRIRRLVGRAAERWSY
jgi:hypothetical protein